MIATKIASMKRPIFYIFILLIMVSCESPSPHKSWRAYRGDDGVNAYSQLNQINKENVNQLAGGVDISHR